MVFVTRTRRWTRLMNQGVFDLGGDVPADREMGIQVGSVDE